MIMGIFDLEGTLVEVTPSYEPDLVRRCWQRLTGKDYSLEQAQAFLRLSFPEQVKYLQTLGFRNMKQFKSAWFTEEELNHRFKALEICSDTYYLNTLRERGMKLGLVTSALRKRAMPLVEKIGANLFAVQVYIHNGNFPDKPHPASLLYCLEELKADRAFYVGDLAKDVEMAHRAGIVSVWINRNNRNSYFSPAPDYQITNLNELERIIYGF